jgi:hypothetical protein
MRVRAERKGLLGTTLIDKGEEFDVDADGFCPAWMIPLDAEAKKAAAGHKEKMRLKKVARIQKEIEVLQAKLDSLGSKPCKKVKEEAEPF